MSWLAVSQSMLKTALAVTAAVGVGAFFVHYRVGFDDGQFRVKPRGERALFDDEVFDVPGGGDLDGGTVDGSPSALKERDAIRIATFDLDPFDYSKIDKPDIINRIVEQIDPHDVVAIQGVHSRSQSVLVALVRKINAPHGKYASGRNYDFICSMNIGGRGPVERFNAFVFNRDTIEYDGSTVREVRDPERTYTVRPLVAAFRAKGPPPNEAFTFTLVNVRVDSPDHTRQVDLLADVYRAVRDDGRGEDDVILLGHLCDRHENLCVNALALTPAIAYLPTTVDGSEPLDNILFDQRATREFVGRTGIVPLLRIYRLSFEQALRICSSVPVWAEFRAYEAL